VTVPPGKIATAVQAAKAPVARRAEPQGVLDHWTRNRAVASDRGDLARSLPHAFLAHASRQGTQAVALSRPVWNLRVPANSPHRAWHFTAFCQRIAHQQSVEPASGGIR
jgi:hypothetical protein